MSFLTPIWLLALAAVSIPVFIHLWNIRPGKTLKVGSIALFSQSSPKSSRSFKLMDLLLLLLRCLLLVLLAVLLSTPLWQRHFANAKAKGWLLIPKENFNEAFHIYKSQIDSLSKKGFEFHYFNQGFTKADLNVILQHKSKDTISNSPANYWELLKQLSHFSPQNIELFTPNTIVHFAGNRPATNLHINWHTFTLADSVNTFLAGAWLTDNGAIRVVQGTATPSGINYQYNNIINGGNRSLYQVVIQHGLPVVSFKNATLNVDTATQQVAIYADKNTLDANYLKAALTAASQFTGQKIMIKTYNEPDVIPLHQDWLFWLTDKPANEINTKAKNVLIYEPGNIANVNSWISNSGEHQISQGLAHIPLYKSVIPVHVKGAPLWADGFGQAVLTADAGQPNIYHFYSRFNPAFSDLVWSDEFPQWLLNITGDHQQQSKNHDRRILADDQIKPLYLDKENVVNQPVNNIDLSDYFWIALALVFLIERWLATRNKTTLING